MQHDQAAEEKLERLREEKRLIKSDLPREGVQLIFRKLRDRADAMKEQYDNIDFVKDPQKGMYIQCYRDIVLKDIPAFFEEIMNHDKVDDRGNFIAPQVKPWSFWRWLLCVLRVRNAD